MTVSKAYRTKNPWQEPETIAWKQVGLKISGSLVVVSMGVGLPVIGDSVEVGESEVTEGIK